MSTTYPEALDAMRARFLAGWNAGTPAIVGTAPLIRWQGRESESDTPNGGSYWVRFSSQTVEEPQRSLGKEGTRLYDSCGLIFIQIFCPRTLPDSFENGRLLAQVARNIFRGQNSGVWFRNARINDDLEPEQGWHRFNVVCEYEFTERA